MENKQNIFELKEEGTLAHLDLEGNPIYWDTYVYAALNPNDK